MYCWLLLQIYPCYLWLLLCSRVSCDWVYSSQGSGTCRVELWPFSAHTCNGDRPQQSMVLISAPSKSRSCAIRCWSAATLTWKALCEEEAWDHMSNRISTHLLVLMTGCVLRCVPVKVCFHWQSQQCNVSVLGCTWLLCSFISSMPMTDIFLARTYARALLPWATAMCKNL